MKILQQDIDKAVEYNKTENSYEVWNSNLKESYVFTGKGNLVISKFFGKYRDFSITECINNWSNTNLKDLNKKVAEILKAMNEQSKQGGCHGCDYSLNQ